jgi:hypothetical protein
MCWRVSYKKRKKIMFFASLSHPASLVRGMNPRIRIRTKMSQIPTLVSPV